MRCLDKICDCPLACGTFTYCRLRNENGLPDMETADAWMIADEFIPPEMSKEKSPKPANKTHCLPPTHP